MEKVTEENPHRLSRREFLRAAGIAAAAVGVSQLASSKSQGLENTQGGEPVPPRRWMPMLGGGCQWLKNINKDFQEESFSFARSLFAGTSCIKFQITSA